MLNGATGSPSQLPALVVDPEISTEDRDEGSPLRSRLSESVLAEPLGFFDVLFTRWAPSSSGEL